MTGREEFIRGPGPRPAATRRRPPVKDCPRCGGHGWIESVEERLPVMRCPCTTRQEDNN